LANVLKINTVRQFLFSFIKYLPYHLTQTLTELNLGKNKIGDQGAQCLANALEINKVTNNFYSHLLHIHHYHLIDTCRTASWSERNQRPRDRMFGERIMD